MILIRWIIIVIIVAYQWLLNCFHISGTNCIHCTIWENVLAFIYRRKLISYDLRKTIFWKISLFFFFTLYYSKFHLIQIRALGSFSRCIILSDSLPFWIIRLLLICIFGKRIVAFPFMHKVLWILRIAWNWWAAWKWACNRLLNLIFYNITL